MQAESLPERLRIARITASEVLSAAADTDSANARIIRYAINTGGLVSDEIVIGLLIGPRLKQPDCASGLVLDGFPGTVPKAVASEGAIIRIDDVVELLLEEAEFLRRITRCRIHESSGHTYHMIF
jgi:adenylate kinase